MTLPISSEVLTCSESLKLWRYAARDVTHVGKSRSLCCNCEGYSIANKVTKVGLIVKEGREVLRQCQT